MISLPLAEATGFAINSSHYHRVAAFFGELSSVPKITHIMAPSATIIETN